MQIINDTKVEIIGDADLQLLLDNYDTLSKEQHELVENFLAYKQEHPLEFYTPLSQMMGFHKSVKTVRAVWGGNSSGKSFCGMREALIYLTLDEHPYSKLPIPAKARGRVTHYDFSMLDKEIIPKLRQLIPRSLWVDGIWDKTYSDKTHFLQLNNGRTCDFLTYDQDVEKHESVTLHWQWADETMPEKFFDACLARILRTGGKFWITVTPLARMGWAVSRLYENASLEDLVDNFFCDIEGNYTLKKEFIDAFSRTINPDEREARLHGRFIQLQGLVYKEMIKGIHTVKGYKLHDNGYSVMALDSHPSKPATISWMEVLPDGSKVVYDEIWKEATIQELAVMIKAKEALLNRVPTIRVVDKHAVTTINYQDLGMNVKTEFAKYGIYFIDSIDDKVAGYSQVHEHLRFDNRKPLDFFNRPRLYICEDTCPQATYQMFHLSWKDNGHEEEKFKHFPDTIRYAIMASDGINTIDEASWDKFNTEIKKIKFSQG